MKKFRVLRLTMALLAVVVFASAAMADRPLFIRIRGTNGAVDALRFDKDSNTFIRETMSQVRGELQDYHLYSYPDYTGVVGINLEKGLVTGFSDDRSPQGAWLGVGSPRVFGSRRGNDRGTSLFKTGAKILSTAMTLDKKYFVFVVSTDIRGSNTAIYSSDIFLLDTTVNYTERESRPDSYLYALPQSKGSSVAKVADDPRYQYQVKGPVVAWDKIYAIVSSEVLSATAKIAASVDIREFTRGDFGVGKSTPLLGVMERDISLDITEDYTAKDNWGMARWDFGYTPSFDNKYTHDYKSIRVSADTVLLADGYRLYMFKRPGEDSIRDTLERAGDANRQKVFRYVGFTKTKGVELSQDFRAFALDKPKIEEGATRLYALHTTSYDVIKGGSSRTFGNLYLSRYDLTRLKAPGISPNEEDFNLGEVLLDVTEDLEFDRNAENELAELSEVDVSLAYHEQYTFIIYPGRGIFAYKPVADGDGFNDWDLVAQWSAKKQDGTGLGQPSEFSALAMMLTSDNTDPSNETDDGIDVDEDSGLVNKITDEAKKTALNSAVGNNTAADNLATATASDASASDIADKKAKIEEDALDGTTTQVATATAKKKYVVTGESGYLLVKVGDIGASSKAYFVKAADGTAAATSLLAATMEDDGYSEAKLLDENLKETEGKPTYVVSSEKLEAGTYTLVEVKLEEKSNENPNNENPNNENPNNENPNNENPNNEDPNASTSSGSGGGCNAGFAAVTALLALALIKKSR